MRRVAWVLVGLSAGCWRENPAFFAAFPEASSGAESSSGGGPDGSTGDVTPGTGSSGGESSATATTGEPGTTSIGPDTTGAVSTTTTGEPDTTSGTTGEIDEEMLCADALAGAAEFIPLFDLGMSMCMATWTSSDDKDQGVISELDCPSATVEGRIEPGALIPVSPDVVFAAGILTAPRKSPTLTGTIEGAYPPISLAGAEHPCLLTRIGCAANQPSCSLEIQISIKSALQPEFDPPFKVLVDTSGPVAVALPLAAFKGDSIDVLLVAVNDGAGAGNLEVVAWEVPLVVDVKP